MLFKLWNSKADLSKLITDTPNTPDLCLLEMHKAHLLFDYSDTLKEEPLSIAVTRSNKLQLWRQHDGKNIRPIVISGVEVPRARIGGALFSVTTEDLVTLDNIRANNIMFNRRRIPILVPNDKDCYNPLGVSAWIYVGCNKYWGDRIRWDRNFYREGVGATFTRGNLVKDSHPWIREYYEFNKNHKLIKPNKKCFIHLRSLDEQGNSS